MLRYRLDDLGWFQFEWLVQSLLKAKFGVGIESWGGRGDHGRDAFHKGSLEFPRDGELFEGPFVFQVKFVEEANAAGAKPRPRIISAVNFEIKRMTERRDLPEKSVYVLISNVALSPELRNEIAGLFQSTFPELEPFTIGGQDLCDLLDNFPNIRTSFPQLLGLRDLDTLLESVVAKPIIERSRAMIEEARELAPIFYPTEAYSEAIVKLTKHNFAVLEGPPEVGKTAIARMIGFARLSMGWEALECLSPDDFFQLYSQEKPQIFIADDAFGSTEYDPSRTNLWSYNLERIIRLLDRRHWLIWTARKHILEIALEKMRLQGKSEEFPHPGSVLVDAANLSTLEKALILYRHAKAEGLDNDAREFVKKHAEMIVLHQHFTPERIRRFVRNSLRIISNDYKDGKLKRESLKSIIQKEIREPTKTLKQAFDCLSEDHKRFLISRLDVSKQGFFIHEDDQKSSFSRHRPAGSKKSYQKIEKELALSFLRSTALGEDWVHPSIRDLIIDYLIENTSERHHFLSSCSTSGVSLAMSVGGGSEGRRNFPLVLDSNDMNIIKSRVDELVSILPPDELLKVLTVTYESKRSSLDLGDDRMISFVDEIFEMILNSVLTRWENKDEPLKNELLRSYYNLASLSKSFMPSPPLSITWQDIVSSVGKALDKRSREGCFEEFSAIRNMFEFVDIVQEEDPRFLKYIGFPKCVSYQLKMILELFIEDAETTYSFESDEEDLYELYIGESHKFETMHEICEEILNLDIDIEIDQSPEEILQTIASAQHYYEQEAEEYFNPEPDYDYRGEAPNKSDASIPALFSDL